MVRVYGSVGIIATGLLLALQPAAAENRWFVGLGGSLTRLETSNFEIDSGIRDDLPPTQTANSGEFSDDPFGWQVYAGWMYTENFGLAVKFADSGDGEDDWGGTITTTDISDPANPLVTVENIDFDGEMSTDGYSVYAVQTLPFNENWEWSLWLGWTDQDLDFDWTSTTDSGSISRDDTGFSVAGLIRYRFTENIAVSVDIEYSTIDFGGLIERPVRGGLNAEFHF